MTTLKSLLNDENGFIVSAELIIVATIVVLSMVVGLSEISFSVNNELEDVGSAVGTMNQSFYANGVQSIGKGGTSGSGFLDVKDNCDGQFDIIPAGVRDETPSQDYDDHDYEYDQYRD
jgi:Flp pilus assembly pilin Flp